MTDEMRLACDGGAVNAMRLAAQRIRTLETECDDLRAARDTYERALRNAIEDAQASVELLCELLDVADRETWLRVGDEVYNEIREAVAEWRTRVDDRTNLAPADLLVSALTALRDTSQALQTTGAPSAPEHEGT